MELNKCCVPGCCGSKKLIKFPDPKSQLAIFKCWLSFINVRTTAADDYNKLYEEYKYKHMCDMHFNPSKCKLQNDASFAVYPVPVLYGPKFWSENYKKLVDALKVAKGKTIVLKENNSIFLVRNEHESATKRMKLTDSPEAPSNSSTTPDKQLTRPRILRKQNTPAMPVVRLERMNLDTSPVKPKSDAQKTKEQETSEPYTRSKSKPTSREASRVSDISHTGSRKSTESEAEDKSLSEDHTDSDTDYEVERIDSDSDDTECEMNTGDDNNMHEEIEYLDMDQLELDESEQAAIRTTRTVYITNKPATTNEPTIINKTLSSLGSQLNTANSVSKTSQNCIQNNTQNSIPDVARDVTIPQIFQEHKRPNIFKEKVQKNAIPEIVLGNDEVSKLMTAVKTYSRTHEKKPPQMIKLIPITAKQNQTIKINNGAIKENVNQTSQGSQPLDKNKLTYMPVLEIDGKTGKLVIQLAAQKPTTESSSTPTTNPTPKEQPVQEPNQSQDASQSSEVAQTINSTRTSFSTTSSDPADLRSLLTKHNITPVDPETTKGQSVKSKTPHEIKKSEVGIPKEILNQAKLLAAKSIQNSMDPTKKTNVYVLDSNGSILLKEQLAPRTLASTAAASKDTPSTVFQKNSSQLNPFDADYTSKKITELNEQAVIASSKINQLNKEASELRNKLNRSSQSIWKLKHTQGRLKQKIKNLNNLESHPKFQKVIEKLPRIARIITLLQFRHGMINKSKPGRRFTQEEKEMAFSLMQECPSVLKYMKRMGFLLPSKKTTRNFKNVESAIDRDDAIEKLKVKVKKMPPHFRLCALLFDEKLISPSNRNRHVVTAVGSEGEETEVTFEADHALIFMVVGILTRYEEPVSYTFSFGPTHGSDLASQIKGVIADLQAVGYKVLATICDHAENNRTAIEILTKEAENEQKLTGDTYKNTTFKVNDEEIIALYDPPHLLKGIRNNLISKNLEFNTNKFALKTAKWEHLEMLLKENPEYRGVRLIPKLTESHVYPTKLDITKVRLASQIFSRGVAVYMGYLAEKDILPPESRDTAELLLFFDSLFDSFNGHSACTQKHLKPLLLAATPKSKHHAIWKEALTVLESMVFVNSGTPVHTSDIECWKWTIEGYKLLLKKLFTEHQVESVWMRVLNQDALERLFRNEVNPSPAVRAKNIMKQTTKGAPTWFAGEVVTQKVIKAITRLNREEIKDNENSAKNKEDSENSDGQKIEDSENITSQEDIEDSENSVRQKYEDIKDSIRQETIEGSGDISELQFLDTQDMPLL